jgi:hypothetical protein
VQKNKPPKTKTHGVFKHHKSTKATTKRARNKKSFSFFFVVVWIWLFLFWWL